MSVNKVEVNGVEHEINDARLNPLTKTPQMTAPVGLDENGKLFAQPSTSEEIEASVAAWLEEHPEATTTLLDGSVTEQKLDAEVLAKFIEIDPTLTESGKAADAKAVGDSFEAISARTNIPSQLSEEGCIAMGNVMKSYYEQAHPASGTSNLVYPSDWRNLFLEEYKDNGVNAIQCAGFSGAIINAIPFGNSRYAGWENNIPLPFGYIWDSTAKATTEYPENPSGAHAGELNVASWNQKLYALEHGFLWEGSNVHIQPACGDVFFQNDSSGKVGHVGMVLYASDIRAANAKVRVIEAWPNEGIRQHTYDRNEIDFFARFPLGYTGGRSHVVYRATSPLSGSVSSLSSIKNLTAEEIANITPGDIVTCRMKANVVYKSGKSAQTGYNFSVRIEYDGSDTNTVWMEQLGEYYYCSFFTPAGSTISSFRLFARGDEQINSYIAEDVRVEIGLCPIPLV